MIRRTLALIGLAGAVFAGAAACARREDPAPLAPGAAFAAVPAAEAPSSAPAQLAQSAQLANAGDPTRGKRLVAQHQCNRCHGGTEDAPAARELDCVGCHREILSGAFPADADKLGRWRPNVTPFRAVPSLVNVGRRLRQDWIARFLVEPHDLRPLLEPTMPRLALAAADARDIAAYFASAAPPREAARAQSTFDRADVTRGRQLIEQRACGSCHAFSGVAALPHTPNAELAAQVDALLLAPDLGHAAERWSAAALVAWLRDPVAEKPDTLMPPTGFSLAEAKDVAAYLLAAPRGAPSARLRPQRLPVLQRSVTFAEVDEHVFRRTCRHCHGDPAMAQGDGGPGNTGGFGFNGRGIDFSSYRAISSGYRHPSGERRSLFEPSADGTPFLVLSLWARHDEEAGRPRSDVRGMPLGLPALSSEQIQLVESWIAQGRPR